MNPTIVRKLEALAERHQEVQALLGDPHTISDAERFRALSREYHQLESVVSAFGQYQQAQADLAEAEEMLSADDAELRELAQEELSSGKARLAELTAELQILLLPRDPRDDNNAFVEVRAGTGGDEAAIFAGDLFRMYCRYAETQGWRMEVISASEGEHGGYKEVIALCSGAGVYGRLKFESGGHRVQRVPTTETQGRIHTSACTVAVMPEVPEAEAVNINPADLRVDTYRASGAGGQHVNRTESAIRITHIPSGVVVECQEERSQHKNRAKAMSVLASRVQAIEDEKRRSEQADTRRSLVGSGDRSERIRTYNFPQGRVTDHRINLTLYRLTEVIQGDLNALIEPILHEHQAELLAALAEQNS